MWVCVCSDISVPSWRPVSVYLGFSFFRLPTSPETFIISSSQIPSRVDIFLDSQFWALALEPHPCMQMPCPGVFLFHWAIALIFWAWNLPSWGLLGGGADSAHWPGLGLLTSHSVGPVQSWQYSTSSAGPWLTPGWCSQFLMGRVYSDCP